MYFPDAAIDLSCYGIFLLLSLFLLHLQCSKWHQIAGWLCLSFVLLDNNVVYEFSSLPGSSRYIFQQDNATPHTAKNWLAQFAVRLLLDWPANSPDLNPIESVWSWMRVFVNKEAPTNKQSLENAILLA